ncbi:MAG: hypothetical protein OEU92_08265 [Alphaproteobacteria bacterium]|nr:hypothetical protein [Alphaproteobacteria bacterium]
MLLVRFASIIPLLPTEGMIDAAHDMGPFERTLVYKHTPPPLVMAVSLIGDLGANPQPPERLAARPRPRLAFHQP